MTPKDVGPMGKAVPLEYSNSSLAGLGRGILIVYRPTSVFSA